MILDGSLASAVATAAQALKNGELVGLPTETVYGLGADAGNDAAVAKIFAAKGRPVGHPLIVHVAQAPDVAHFAHDVPAFAHALMQAFWPGPLTLILPRRTDVGAAAAGGQNSIGLRCPAHPVAHALLLAARALGVPGVAAPSANQFGRVSPTSAAHVQSEMGDALLILDGGPCAVGIESTIIDCTRGAPVLLRPGHITRESVQAACGLRLLSEEELAQELAASSAAQHATQNATRSVPAPRASGTLESHYAPKAKVRLMDAHALQAALDVIGDGLAGEPGAAPATHQDRPLGSAVAKQVGPTIATYSRALLRTPSAQVLRRRMPDDAKATAQQLFAVLREFDAQGVKLIWVETPPDTPEWEGVRDRLMRAAA